MQTSAIRLRCDFSIVVNRAYPQTVGGAVTITRRSKVDIQNTESNSAT